jgi:hypothetical protein
MDSSFFWGTPVYFYPHFGIFDMDVNLPIIFIMRDRISVTKILNVSHVFFFFLYIRNRVTYSRKIAVPPGGGGLRSDQHRNTALHIG